MDKGNLTLIKKKTGKNVYNFASCSHVLNDVFLLIIKSAEVLYKVNQFKSSDKKKQLTFSFTGGKIVLRIL